MTKTVRIVVALVMFGCTFMLSNTAFAKAKPVPGIMGMFTNFNELEESFRGDDWAAAMSTVKKIEKDYKVLVKDLKGTVDGKTIQKFGFLIGSFKKHLSTKDQEAVEKPFLNLQTMFIDIMDNYDYEAPPVLIIVARYIDEAKEALEKNAIDDVGEEMEEIGGFKDRVVKAFTEKGMGKEKIDAFFEMVEQGDELAKNEDKAGLEALLEKLAGVMAPYAQDDN